MCLFQSWFYVESYVEPQGLVAAGVCKHAIGQLVWHWKIAAVLTMTAGTMFLMWLGEQIDEFGIGNGISLLIMAGILARMPGAGYQLLQQASLELSGGGSKLGIEDLIVLAAMFVAVVTGVVFITLGQRRIPDAKRQARPRPPRLRRHATVPAAEGQSGRRHADHLRQQLADVPDDHLSATWRTRDRRNGWWGSTVHWF